MKNRKRIISIVITLTLTLSSMVTVSAGNVDDPVGPYCHRSPYNSQIYYSK